MIPESLSPDCLRFQDLFQRQLDEDHLTAPEALYVEAHPVACQFCKAYAQQMEAVLETLRTLEPLPVPVDLGDRVLAKIKQPVAFRRPLYVAIAASVLALVVSTAVLSTWHPLTPDVQKRSIMAALPVPMSQKPANAVPSKTKLASPTSKPLAKSPIHKPQRTASPPATHKVLIAMAPPKEGVSEMASSDLLAHWVPLEEASPAPSEGNPELMGTSSEEIDDPMSTLVGF